MNPKKPTHTRHLPDFDPELEDDSVWSMLDQASPPELSSRFTADTLRRCRLEADSPKSSWWHKLLSPKPLIGAAVAALALVATVISLPKDPAPAQAKTAPISAPEPADRDQIEDTLAEELLTAAAEDPSLLSDEEIVSLLF